MPKLFKKRHGKLSGGPVLGQRLDPPQQTPCPEIGYRIFVDSTEIFDKNSVLNVADWHNSDSVFQFRNERARSEL